MVAIVFLLVAGMASWLPARRAAALDPARASAGRVDRSGKGKVLGPVGTIERAVLDGFGDVFGIGGRGLFDVSDGAGDFLGCAPWARARMPHPWRFSRVGREAKIPYRKFLHLDTLSLPKG